MEAALEASDFARSVLDAPGSLRFEKWEQGGELAAGCRETPYPCCCRYHERMAGRCR